MQGHGKTSDYRQTELVRVQRPAIYLDQLEADLDDPFADEPVHHRWLLTTCIAGIIGTLVVGGAALGLFGENAAPGDAFASIDRSTVPGTKSKLASIASLSSQDTKVILERGLGGDNNYPEITADDLPYGDGKTVVLDAEIQASETESGNITIISKTPPAEPIDESFKIAKGRSLVDELTNRGVTKEAAQALAAAIEPVFPARMIMAGTEFELTLDRQQDFYGRDATFPVQLSFKPGPNEKITVEADEDGRFIAKVDGK